MLDISGNACVTSVFKTSYALTSPCESGTSVSKRLKPASSANLSNHFVNVFFSVRSTAPVPTHIAVNFFTSNSTSIGFTQVAAPYGET